MDYEYYDNSPDVYSPEGDVTYRLEDDWAETAAESSLQGNIPDQFCTYSDDFYNEEFPSSPSPNWQPQEMRYHQGHSLNLIASQQYMGRAPGSYESSINPMHRDMDRMNGQNQTQSFQPNNYHAPANITQNYQMSDLSQPRTIPSNPRNGVRVRPVSDLPDMYKGIFKFGVFNGVQSTCFDTIINGNKNLVISAPTGSGKTVLFELGIIRAMNQNRSNLKQFKCVYIAPTKALCSERFRDWAAKFEPLGMKCCELTGDSVVLSNNAWGEAKNASIIITTCEKWDSLTRNWQENNRVLSQIQLFMVDEVHILNESRGSTLEVVASRMKLRGSNVRFMLVSATVPNIADIAAWIGSGATESDPALVYEFGDDFRPCKLTRHVVGLHRRHGQNDFQFAKILDFKLFSVIQEYSVGKPTLVFCSTRKGVFATAEQLMKEFAENEANKKTLPWTRPPRTNHAFVDKRLDELATFGIGVHHAGLSLDDRRATEDLYLKRVIRVLVATSTLAVGVNLPAHMVVIKGVNTFQNNASVEYSDLDIMQMLGRAGRPQFDKDGIAVIICESELEQKYKALVQGKTILESSLHINLAEHLNSEIGLGTITDVDTAKGWLRSSFLYQRMQCNPEYYALSLENKTIRESIEDLLTHSIAQLEKTKLVNHVEDGSNGKLTSTEYGKIMSKFYIRRATMELILSLPEKASLREILEVISAAEEFQDVKLRASEKSVFNKLRKHMDIRYEIKRVEKTSDKVFLLIQSVLGGISLNSPEYKTADSQPHMEAFTIFKHVARISRAVMAAAICGKFGSQVKNSLELSRCLTAKAWEDRAMVLRQIEQIGEKSIKVLAEHGITSLDILRKQDPLRIDQLLNRRPPFGLSVLASAAEFPQYSLNVKETDIFSDSGMNPVQVHLLIECGLVNEVSPSIKPTKKSRHAMSITVVLTLTSDMDVIDFRRIPTTALTDGRSFEVITELTKPSQTVIVIITSESIAGVTKQHTYKPNIPAIEYPVLDTKPLSSVEQDLVGLEDDPDFWNMSIDTSSVQVTASTPKKEDKTADIVKKAFKSNPQKAAKNRVEAKPHPNKTFECSHRCQDKNSCHHMNYQKLVQVNPVKLSPKLPREPSKSKAVSSLQKLHPPNKGFASSDRNLKELKSIHDRTQVSQNIKLSEGRRLLPKPKRKRYIDPNFDIQFTDLQNPELDDASDSNGMEYDSDDLPEAILLAAVGKEEPQAMSLKVTKTNETIRSKPVLSSSSRMANSDPLDDNPTKRIKTAHSSAENKRSTESALFLEISDDENCIEIVPSPKSQKGGPRRSSSFQSRDTDRVSGSTLTGHSCLPSRWTELEIYKKLKQAADTVIDSEFAELDAWLDEI